jgi:hypothetical protein
MAMADVAPTMTMFFIGRSFVSRNATSSPDREAIRVAAIEDRRRENRRPTCVHPWPQDASAGFAHDRVEFAEE